MPHDITPLAMLPLEPALLAEAVNDSHVASTPWTDVNLLVATTVARVSTCLRPEHVNVELSLAEGQPVASGDSTALAFALSGTLSALLHGVDEEGNDGRLRVEVAEHHGQVLVSLIVHDVPPLGLVRALADGVAPASPTDPTVAHCRRLVEACGGTLRLASQNSGIAVEMRLRCCPLDNGLRILPPYHLRTQRTPTSTQLCAVAG